MASKALTTPSRHRSDGRLFQRLNRGPGPRVNWVISLGTDGKKNSSKCSRKSSASRAFEGQFATSDQFQAVFASLEAEGFAEQRRLLRASSYRTHERNHCPDMVKPHGFAPAFFSARIEFRGRLKLSSTFSASRRASRIIDFPRPESTVSPPISRLRILALEVRQCERSPDASERAAMSRLPVG